MQTKNQAAKKQAKLTFRPLPVEFEKCQFLHVQVKREGDIAIFKKSHVPKPWNRGDYEAGYEVVIIKRHNGYYLGDQWIEPAETYPPNSLWGILGWTISSGGSDENNLQRAEEKFQEIVARVNSKTLDVSDVSIEEGDDE